MLIVLSDDETASIANAIFGSDGVPIARKLGIYQEKVKTAQLKRVVEWLSVERNKVDKDTVCVMAIPEESWQTLEEEAGLT